MWEKVQAMLNAPPLINVDNHEWERAADSIDNAPFGWTLGAVFDSYDTNARTRRNTDGSFGIFYRASRHDITRDANLLLHEVLHVLYPPTESLMPETDLDEQLASAWGIRKYEGESDSAAIDRFLKSGCDPALADEPEVIKVQ